jgi:hypothetical protein
MGDYDSALALYNALAFTGACALALAVCAGAVGVGYVLTHYTIHIVPR